MNEDSTAIVLDYETVSFKERFTSIARQFPSALKKYVLGMLPFARWIPRYNMTWLVQDLVAGVTVGIVIVPQSMAYAKVAGLAPQYGLYSSFVGVTLYCLLGTSKDISVGPISTVSLLVGTVVNSVMKMDPDTTPASIAATLGLFTGMIMIVMSLLQLGVFVELIPEPAIAGYMTGSAITIILSQCPKLLGISPEVSTNQPPYLVFINILSKLPFTKLDAAFGLTALVLLYAIRYFTGLLKFENSPRLQKAVFMFGIMRSGLVVVFGTLISFLITRSLGNNSPVSVIESVPSGFDAMGVPRLHWKVLQEAGSTLPSIVLILILEHITVAKSFGRIYKYAVDSDQEILAIGVCNVIAPFFGGYPSTGAFSRTAIMARSGARTPMAGVFSGIVIILALYVLTPAFHYIPDAILAAVVIHAVSDLVSKTNYLKELFLICPCEVLVWASAVIVTVFVNVQTGIYVGVGLSLAIILYRLSRPSLKVLAPISSEKSSDDTQHRRSCPRDREKKKTDYNDDMEEKNEVEHVEVKEERKRSPQVPVLFVDDKDPNFKSRISPDQTSILVIKLAGPLVHTNAEYISEYILFMVESRTRCGNEEDLQKSARDRSWSYCPPTNNSESQSKPIIRALVLDFGSVAFIDSTAVKVLKTTRTTVNKYAGITVEWHFSNIQTPWVRSSLLAGGFGTLDENEPPLEHASSFSSVASGSSSRSSTLAHNGHHLPVPVDKYCCFHWDVNAAMSAINRRWEQTLFI